MRDPDQPERDGFDLGDFLRSTLIGGLMGGLSGVAFYGMDKAVKALKGSLSGSEIIHNDILDCPRTGSALKVDEIAPIYEIDAKTGRPYMIREFPSSAQAHGFNDIIDNYAGYTVKTSINNGVLYQIEGSLNGVAGRFEWIIQEGRVTHRMFIQNRTLNGVPIKP